MPVVKFLNFWFFRFVCSDVTTAQVKKLTPNLSQIPFIKGTRQYCRGKANKTGPRAVRIMDILF